LMKDSMFAGLFSILLAFATSFVISLPLKFEITSALSTILAPGFLAVPLSLIVGAAAALSFTTGFRDQIAGVAVAVALVPPIAAAGLTFGAERYLLGLKALNLAVMNVLAVILSGFVCLKVFGLEPTTYYKEKSAESMHKAVPIVFVLIMFLSIPLAFSFYDSPDEVDVSEESMNYLEEDFISVNKGSSGYTVFSTGNYSEKEFESSFDELNVDLVLLEEK